MLRIVVFLFFLLSGISGLVFEVVWTRLLTTILGNTVYAVSIVLSAYMAGLAIGSLIASRYLDTRRDPLRIYAVLEICIGITGFCLTLAFIQTGPLYVWLHQLLSANGNLLTVGRYLFAFFALAIPTTLMGATLPVLSRFAVDHESKIGMTVGMLYALNTLGAAAGCYAAGFILIGSAGIIKTVLVASSINIIIGVAAWLLGEPGGAATGKGLDRVQPAAEPSIKPQVAFYGTLVLAAFAVSGFTSMGYEIAWTRILITYMGNTVYAFSAMLASFLLGLALGSACFSLFVNRLSRLFVWFALLQLGIGLYMLASLYVFGNHFQHLLPFISPNPVVPSISSMFVKALSLMLVPTFLMGASFPVAARLYVTRFSTVARKVGTLYAWNTIACIVGSTVTGFLLIPVVGFEKSLVIMLALNIVTGSVLFAAEPLLGLWIKTVTLIVVLAVAGAGALFMPRSIIRTMHATLFHKEEKVVFYRETPYGVVEVLQGPSRRRLVQDDLDLAGTSMAYLSSQKPLGHLPMLLHPNPESVFIIGFGAGGASYAVSTYPSVKSIAIAELNKSIIKAAPLFTDMNHGVLSNPKCTLAINDGRHFLLTTRARYDVISVDLLWPQTAGAGSLYTKEFYRLCSNRLSDGGIMVEWIHTGLIPKEYLRIILKTVREVFPYAALWTSRSFGHLFLVASNKRAFEVDYQTLADKIRTPAVSRDLSEIGLSDPAMFVSYFIADGAAIDRIIDNEKRLNTDNMPIIEYKLPFIRNWTWNDNAVGIMRFKRPVLPLLGRVDSSASRRIMHHEQIMMMVLQSKVHYTRGDQWGAITLCTDAFRADPAHPEAFGWYEELKYTMKCMSDSGKAPPGILSAFDTTYTQ